MKRRGFLAALAAIPFIGRWATPGHADVLRLANGLSYAGWRTGNILRLSDRYCPSGGSYLLTNAEGSGRHVLIVPTDAKPILWTHTVDIKTAQAAYQSLIASRTFKVTFT